MSTGTKIFAMYDKKVSIYRWLHPADNIPDAIRNLQKIVTSQQGQITDYPEDYDLYHLGDFDEVTGKITVVNPPQYIISAINLIKEKESKNDGKKS